MAKWFNATGFDPVMHWFESSQGLLEVEMEEVKSYGVTAYYTFLSICPKCKHKNITKDDYFTFTGISNPIFDRATIDCCNCNRCFGACCFIP